MFGRKNRKRHGSAGSIDLLAALPSPTVAPGPVPPSTVEQHPSAARQQQPPSASQPTPSQSQQKEKAYQYLLGRVGFGQRERSRTSSDDGSAITPGSSSRAATLQTTAATTSDQAVPSPTTATGGSFGGKLFGTRGATTSTTDKGVATLASLPYSASLQDVSSIPRSAPVVAPIQTPAGSTGFFRRQPTTSTTSRPAWLSRGAADRPTTPSPLTPSPSSPTLSSQAAGGTDSARRRDGSKREDRVYVYSESGKQLAALSGGPSNQDLGRLGSPSHHQLHFSRSAEDLSRSPTPTSPNPGALKNLPPRQTSLSPATAVISNPRSGGNSSSPAQPPTVPFPTSASTPNLYGQSTTKSSTIAARASPNLNGSSPTISETDTANNNFGDRRRDSQTIYCQGFLLRKGDYPSSSAAGGSMSLSSPALTSPSSTPVLITPSPVPSDSNQTLQASPSLPFSARSASPLIAPHSPKIPPSPGATNGVTVDLSKGLKPYRAILKGSKLYLHKVPGDLMPVCRTLFPVGSEPAPSPTNGSSPGTNGIAKDPGSWGTMGGEKRRKRTFWGTGEKGVGHPELLEGEKVVDGERIQLTGGTMDALAHELVFATRFTQVNAEKDGEDAATEEKAVTDAQVESDKEVLEEYKNYVSTLLLHLPFLPVSLPAAASELDRCATLAVRTALEAPLKVPPSSLTKRLELLLDTVALDFWDDLGDQSDNSKAWTAAVEEVAKLTSTLPNVTRDFPAILKEAVEKNGAVKRKAVTEYEVPAPRPAYSRTGSSSSTSTSGSPTKTRKRMPSEPLEIAPSLTTQAFLHQDPVAFAREVHLFHLDRLGALVGRSSTPRLILRAAAVLMSDVAPKPTTLTSLFSFTASAPHPVSRIVIQTIIPPAPPATTPNPIPTTLFSGPGTSVITTRATVLARWIKVGEELRKRGDAAGWVAVASALCSRAVARLDETWRLLDKDSISIVRNEWAPILTGLGWIDGEDVTVNPLVFAAQEKDCEVPYWGSILEEAVVALKAARSSVSEKGVGNIDLSPLYGIRRRLDAIDEMWHQNPAPTVANSTVDPSIQVIIQYYSRLITPAKPALAAYLPSSLELEPRLPSLHLNIPLKPRSAHDPSPLLPLLMVEPLPFISLVDQEKILQTAAGSIPRKQSVSGLSHQPSTQNMKTVPPPATCLARHNSYPPHATPTMDRGSIFTRLRKEIETPSDTLLRYADGDIVFRILSAALPALPTATSNERGMLSRTSSWIESRSARASTRGLMASTTSSRALSPLRSPSKPSSTASPRNSLTAELLQPAPKLQVAGGEEPVHVVVRSGTVEALVDLLVMGTDSMRTPSTDADGESSLTGRRPLELDMESFRAAFFATFRSFTTSLVVLDLLRKRYLAAPSASSEYVHLSSAKPFPTWSLRQADNASDTLNSKVIAQVRLAIVESLRYWVDHHVTDFVDDDDLFSGTSAFLSFVVVTESAVSDEHPDLDSPVLALASALRKRFARNTLRPVVQPRKVVHANSTEEATTLSYDQMTPAALVDSLDRVAVEVSGDVTENDLLRYINVLEASVSAEPCAWYSSRLLAKTDDDDIVVTDPYTHIQAIGADSSLHKGLPLSLQHCVQTHATVRRWILCHLVDPDLNMDQRKARMVKALEMVEICRARMSNVFFGGQAEPLSHTTDPSLASFVERAILSAIVAPESRLFGSAWLAVAGARGVALPDSVASLIKPSLVLTDSTATLDLAWLNERLVEITTQVESLSEGASINFAKRRWIFNCVRNALSISPSQGAGGNAVLEQMERRLNGWGNWGPRLLRDVASSEGTKHTKSTRPFSRLVAQQQEKVRRDRQTRDVVAKGVKIEQQGRLQREKEVAKAMEKSVAVRSKRMTSIFRVGRPATAPTGLPPAPLSPSITSLQALRNWTPTSKPYLVLALSGVSVEPYDSPQRPFVFELSTEDGQRSLFQAPTREEMEIWVSNFRRSGTQIAFRRATFLAETPLAEEPDDYITAKPGPVAPPVIASKGVFNVPLWDLLEQEGSTIPRFIETALEIIEARGLSEVGIYRISGESRVITEMKEALNRGANPGQLIHDADVHNITGLVKLFLRELPEPVLPFEFYHPFIAANAIEDYDERLYAIRDLVWKMPQSSFHLLRRFTEHLDKITDNEGVNAMHAANLSIIFAPTLLKPAPSPATFGISMANLGKAANIVKSLILQQNWIFGEEVAEDEVEGEQDVVHGTGISDPAVQDEEIVPSVVGLGVSETEAEFVPVSVSTVAPEQVSNAEVGSEKDADEPDEGSVDSHSTSYTDTSERRAVDYRASIDLMASPKLPELSWSLEGGKGAPPTTVDLPPTTSNAPAISTTVPFQGLTLPSLPSPISDSFSSFADSFETFGR